MNKSNAGLNMRLKRQYETPTSNSTYNKNFIRSTVCHSSLCGLKNTLLNTLFKRIAQTSVFFVYKSLSSQNKLTLGYQTYEIRVPPK